MEKQKTHGGQRENSGRKKLNSVVYYKRVPQDIVFSIDNHIKTCIPNYNVGQILFFTEFVVERQKEFIVSARIIKKTSENYFIEGHKFPISRLHPFTLKGYAWSADSQLRLDSVSTSYLDILRSFLVRKKKFIIYKMMERDDETLKKLFLDALFFKDLETALYVVACKMDLEQFYSCEFCDANYKKNALYK